MAQLKDTVVSGSLRATDSLLTTTLQTQILNIPTTSGGTTYGPGTDGYIVSTNGTSIYWRGVKNNTTVGDLGWSSTTNDFVLITSNTLAYWNGRYNSNTSNLAYCNKGAFGTIVTYAAASANTASTAVVRDASGNFSAGTITASLSGNATTASTWKDSRTLTIGNKGQSVNGGSDVSWTLNDILYNSTTIGTDTSWDQLGPSLYYVASSTAFTGTNHPGNNSEQAPYTYGQLIVSRAGAGGILQIYAPHTGSAGNVNSGLRYRTGWNSAGWQVWSTILDDRLWRKYIFANKNIGRATLTVTDSGWTVTSGTDVFGLAFKDTGLTYTPSGGSATASSDTGDWRAWLTCAADANTVTLNMRIDGTWQASKFIGPLQGNADTATKATQDSDGNTIKSTYLKLSGGTMTGDIKGNSTAALGTTANPFHNIVLGGATGATMSASSTNPRITFQENTGTQPVHLIYTDSDTYRSPAGLKVIGGTSATPAWFEVEGGIWAGRNCYCVYSSPHLEFQTTGLTNMKATDNGLSGDATAGIHFRSKDGTDWVGGFRQVYTKSTGDVSTYMYARNYKTDGTTVNNYIIIHSQKDGTRTYDVADGTAFRSAIGVGASGTHADSYFVKTSGDTMTNTLTLSAGQLYVQKGSVWAGTYAANTAQASEYQVGVSSGAGQLYMYSNAGVAGNRGLYGRNAAGTYKGCLTIDKDNNVTLDGNAATATRINGNLSAVTSGNHNIWVSDAATPDGIPRYVSNCYITGAGYLYATRVYNAVWNDYAECRQVATEEPGYCVTETSNGVMIKSYKRLQAGCKITSDTYGTCMGETANAKVPVAVAGRVLVHTYRNRSEYPLGAAVCSAPNGTVDVMTRDEIMMYPERIVGTVSEIPNYEVWHGGNQDGKNEIQVNDRIWIYVK